MPVSMSLVMATPMAQLAFTEIATSVLVTVLIIAVEVAVGAVVSVTSMVAAASPIAIIIEPIHGIDQRIGHGRTYQQVQRRVAVVVCARTQRNRQARGKPSDGKPLEAVLGSKGSGSNSLFSGIHRLVLFQQCNGRMRCSG